MRDTTPTRTLTALLLMTALALAGFAGSTEAHKRAQKQRPQQSPVFLEAALRAGIDFQHYNGANGKFHLPEIMGSGAAMFDYDNDGDLDIFLVQCSALEPGMKPDKTLFPWRGSIEPRSRLYRNDLAIKKDGSRQLKFTDVTDKSGLLATGYGMGAAAADINNDGWIDLYITNLGSNHLMINNGDGTFTDATKKSATGDDRWSASAAFFDYDRDGWLDLFVTNLCRVLHRKQP